MRFRSSAYAAAVTAVALMLAGPALGASVGDAAARSPANAGSRAPTAPNLVFAGYVVNRIGSRMAITTTFIAPKLKCTHAPRAIAASVRLFARARESAAELFVGCVNGQPRYFPVLIANGTRRNYTAMAVRQGDKIVLKAADGPGRDTVTVIDETNKAIQKTVTGRGSNRISGPWVGDLAWRNGKRTERVPDFGMLGYSASKLDGKGLGSYRKGLEGFNRVDTAGTLQIKTSKLAQKRESFKTLFEHV